MDEMPIPRRLIAVCMLVSLLLHGVTAGWLLSARDSIVPTGTVEPVSEEQENDPPASEETRLGISSSTRATITWLGFADPTPHHATESELDQAAFRMAPIGAPEPPGTPDPGEAPREPDPSPQRPNQPPTQQAGEPASVPAPAADQPARAAAEPEAADAEDAKATRSDNPTPGPAEGPATIVENPDPVASAPDKSKETEAAQPDPEEPKEPSPSDEQPEPKPPQPAPVSSPPAPAATDSGDPSPPAKQTGAATRPGELSDRESTPTSKTIDLAIQNWGRPAAGEGIEIKTRHPQFPDTLAIFRRVLDATVLIRFGADGFVRDVRFETVTVNKKPIVRSTGSPEGDRVVLNCVYNWTASGKEIEALKDLGPDATVTIRMEMHIRP